MAVYPRIYVEYATLGVAEKAVVDAYTALTAGEKEKVRNNLYLCDESSVELGNGYAEALEVDQNQLRNDILEYFTVVEIESMFTGLSAGDKVVFLAAIAAMMIAAAQTEVWAESCYAGLSLSDKTLFLENIHADAETLAGIVHGYNHLVASDQLAAFETFCVNLREKPEYYNLFFKH